MKFKIPQEIKNTLMFLAIACFLALMFILAVLISSSIIQNTFLL